jgi:hypothetical protein
MKTKEIKKENSLLNDLRSIRNNITEELLGKSPEQIVELLKQKKTLHLSTFWQKKVEQNHP